MNTYLQKIINKYKEFKDYIASIDTDIFNKFTRQELIEFEKELRSSGKFKYISLDVNKIIEQKKLEEYPELLGVHHYPEIKEIDFLSKEQKVELDEYLYKIGVNKYAYPASPLWRELFGKWDNEIRMSVLQFLENKQIIERYYDIYICDNCDESTGFSYKELSQFIEYFIIKENINNNLSDEEINKYYITEELLNYKGCCQECGNDKQFTKEELINEIAQTHNRFYKIIKPRDKTYDNK